MKKKSSVTVIMPTYNRAEYITASIDSIMNQTVKPDFIIVVNDGSTDHTEQVLQPYQDKIRYLVKENAGKPAAINFALEYVDTDYLWIFDDDDIACYDSLARHIEVLDCRDDIGFTYSGSYYSTSGPDNIVCVHRDIKVREFEESESFMELLMSSYTGSPAVIVKMSLMNQIGGYNEALLRSQDYEIGLRLLLKMNAARLSKSTPTFFRRYHDGERGAANSRFSSQEMTKKWREFERQIMTEANPGIELYHYLPREQWHHTLSEEQKLKALVRKFVVHMNKGIYDKACECLMQLSASSEIEVVLGETELNYLLRSFSSSQECVIGLGEDLTKLCDNLNHSNLVFIKSQLIRALGFLFVSKVKARDHISILKIAGLSIKLFGISFLLKTCFKQAKKGISSQ